MEKRTKDWVWWALVNTSWAALVAVAAEGNKYASNLVKFLCWILFLLSVALVLGQKTSLAKDLCQRQRIPAKVDFLYDVGIVFLLVAFGWFFYGVLYFLHAFFLLGVKEIQKEV